MRSIVRAELAFRWRCLSKTFSQRDMVLWAIRNQTGPVFNFFWRGHTHFRPRPVFWFCVSLIFRNFGPEGRRDSIFSLKLPQWPHLYKTYEATYALKCSEKEIFAKNLILGIRPTVLGWIFVSWPRIVLETIWIHQNVRNCFIYIRLMKKHMLQNDQGAR